MPKTYYKMATPEGLPLLECWSKEISAGQNATRMQSYASLRIVRICRGDAVWQVGTETLPAHSGDLFLFNNQEPRRILQISSKDPLGLETLAFLPFALYPNQAVLSVFFGQTRTRRLPAAVSAPFLSILDEIHQEAASEKNFRLEMSLALLTKLVVLLARSCAVPDPAPYAQEEYHRVMQAVSYLHRHITAPLREETLARQIGMSTAAFSRAFRRCNGITLAAYLRRCRVQMALARIREENGNVLETALQCGFSSSSGFYKAVREVTGKSPRRGQ